MENIAQTNETQYVEGVICPTCGKRLVVHQGVSKTKKNPDGTPKSFTFWGCEGYKKDGPGCTYTQFPPSDTQFEKKENFFNASILPINRLYKGLLEKVELFDAKNGNIWVKYYFDKNTIKMTTTAKVPEEQADAEEMYEMKYMSKAKTNEKWNTVEWSILDQIYGDAKTASGKPSVNYFTNKKGQKLDTNFLALTALAQFFSKKHNEALAEGGQKIAADGVVADFVSKFTDWKNAATAEAKKAIIDELKLKVNEIKGSEAFIVIKEYEKKDPISKKPNGQKGVGCNIRANRPDK